MRIIPGTCFFPSPIDRWCFLQPLRFRPSPIMMTEEPRDVAKKYNTEEDLAPFGPIRAASNRPPVDFSSPSAFIETFSRRWKAVWTKRFLTSLLFGQIVALCITCTNVTTTELVTRNWALPTTQTFFLYVNNLTGGLLMLISDPSLSYFALFIVYTPYTMYKCRRVIFYAYF
jgi:hypothetical protein